MHLNVALLESEIKAQYSQEEEKLEDKALRIVENYIDYELDQISNSLKILIEGIEQGYHTPHRYPRLYHLLFELIKRELVKKIQVNYIRFVM